ncbi:GCN5-related N-acetyltransferase [Alkaliphilus metalliredigens QYMF]|uniref:GCN5-related N-acetyltransferase n=1 Tax=Alkaliphilus metalliredigens (strain QYMF) TaxID=293826 RepID=A6TN83_ALKMQ|nr:GNAT family N-acetyltransferase [Alkaliphilus metalliredigens]ABR47651.1 GCN5-related N-acetyltransferase [Alkaliphilus metalliredigens QYMF]
MMNISIHRPTAIDYEELTELFRVVITDTMEKEGLGGYDEQINSEVKEKKKFLEEDVESNGEERFFLVARYREKIVGTVAYGPCGEAIKNCSKGKYNHMGEIGTVFILPQYQDKGIGSLLLNSMYLALMGMNVEEFCLDSGYTKAKQIWCKKLGEPNIIKKNYWGEGYDHFIWHRKLKEITITFDSPSTHRSQ